MTAGTEAVRNKEMGSCKRPQFSAYHKQHYWSDSEKKEETPHDSRPGQDHQQPNKGVSK